MVLPPLQSLFIVSLSNYIVPFGDKNPPPSSSSSLPSAAVTNRRSLSLSPLWTGHRGAQKRIALTRTDSARRAPSPPRVVLSYVAHLAGRTHRSRSLRWERHISKKKEGLEFVSTRWRDDE